MVYSKTKKKWWMKWLYFILILICCSLFFIPSLYNEKLVYENEVIEIERGDSFSKFYKKFWGIQKYMIKIRLRNNADKVPTIQEWRYMLNWEFTKEELLEYIAKWPQREYVHVTVLEWWSRYDIDAKLSEDWMINPWEYISKTEDQYFIEALKLEYPFLSMIPQWKSLEGFLYPDTYYLDEWQWVVEQLIKAQIKNFEKKVRSVYSSSFELVWLQISPYGILTLASIIENEEKNKENKPIIAWIFVNRLNKWMRLDADVSLCYGLKLVYSKCRENINKNLDDASNLYNTRQNYWLTPTPISSPTDETINSLLNYKKTSAIFYLHDANWGIHYAETMEWHNENKRLYL
jgi:UPF0755 protein